MVGMIVIYLFTSLALPPLRHVLRHELSLVQQVLLLAIAQAALTLVLLPEVLLEVSRALPS